jgi:hypothetical protein
MRIASVAFLIQSLTMIKSTKAESCPVVYGFQGTERIVNFYKDKISLVEVGREHEDPEIF